MVNGRQNAIGERIPVRRLNAYYGGGQRVWAFAPLTCTDAKIASLHLIAPVITLAPTVARDLRKRPSAQRFPAFS